MQAALQQQRRALQEARARSAALEIRAAEAQRGFADRAAAADARFEELLRQARFFTKVFRPYFDWITMACRASITKLFGIFQTGTPLHSRALRHCGGRRAPVQGTTVPYFVFFGV